MSNLWVTSEELGEFAETEFSYEAVKSASYLMWALSGRKYSGITTVTERYICAGRTFRFGPSTKNTDAILMDGTAYNIFSDNLDFYEDIASDGTTSSSRIRLRGRPVTKIHTIRNRLGQVIDSSQYYLVDNSTIHAVTGVKWTACNVEVTYTYGIEPPTLGKMAARTLAIEFVKLYNNDDDCALPQRVTSISRQGVSYTLLDSQDFINEMRTGIYAVDLFLKAVNPDRARNKARVFSPDIPRARRNTPKPLTYAVSDLDITVPANGIGSMNVSLNSINADFLLDTIEWTPEVIIRNSSASKSKSFDNAVTFTDPTPTSINVIEKSIENNVATLVTSGEHNLFIGTEIIVAGVGVPFDGSFVVGQIPNTTTVQYSLTDSDIPETATTGTITSNTDDRITVSLSYDDVRGVLGMVDPGTWDLYGNRVVDEVFETTYIGSGNLSISLSTPVINAYTV